MKKVIAVTVNYNKDDSTKKLLESFEKVKSTDFDLHIIVVDNGTKKEFSLDKKNDAITIIRPGVNTGFSGGNNIGIKKALEMGADYVFLINNDTIVDPYILVELRRVMEDKNAGIVTPKIYFEKGREFHKERYKTSELGRIIWYAGGSIDWANAKAIHRGVDEVDRGQYDKEEKINFATGCAMLIKKEVFEKVGYFDERYFLYYEDADLSLRVMNSGFEIFYAPKAFLYHENASSSGSGSPLHDYFLTRNQMIFGMKYTPFSTKLSLIRQSISLLINGREFQKKGIIDYYSLKFGKGSFPV